MPRPASKTVFVLVPGASQSPAHYGYLLHLLLTHGHPVYSAILPSTGSNKNVTVQDDTDYVREQMLLPILDIEQHNVIMIMHSYRWETLTLLFIFLMKIITDYVVASQEVLPLWAWVRKIVRRLVRALLS
jgi:hypothetical protein